MCLFVIILYASVLYVCERMYNIIYAHLQQQQQKTDLF
jgi:hypothetical protein